MEITLKAARVNKGITQEEAATALGVNVVTLRNYESGRTMPTVDIVKRIEMLYDISYNDINFSCR